MNELGTIAIDDSFNFFNPKLGVTYSANENTQWYLSYAKAQREPNRTDYENEAPDQKCSTTSKQASVKKEVVQPGPPIYIICAIKTNWC